MAEVESPSVASTGETKKRVARRKLAANLVGRRGSSAFSISIGQGSEWQVQLMLRGRRTAQQQLQGRRPQWEQLGWMRLSGSLLDGLTLW